MKNLICVFLYLLPLSAPSQQLSEKYSIYIQGGFISSLYVKEAMFKHIVSETHSHHHACPILSAGFQWNISNKWRVGPTFSYDHFGLKDRSVEYNVLSYLLRCDRIWKETKKINFYSGLSLGVRTLKQFENENLIEHNLMPGYHIYLIGTEFNIKQFAFDLNVGIGTSGIVNLGGKYRF